MKSHFMFTKQQRSGIFLLLILIIIFLAIQYLVEFKSNTFELDAATLKTYQKEIDSLKIVKLQDSKPTIYPFNPNYITDFKGYTLGMSVEEIDRLLAYRSQNRWVNTALEFQKVTGISDSLLNTISPYFKFPEWVTNPKNNITSNPYANSNTPKTYAQKQDLNTATALQLQSINGIGEKLSQRIIEIRQKYKGSFASDIELTEVWGLSPEVIERITQQFTVKTPRAIQKINLNTANRDELVIVPYIDYEIAAKIIETRTLREGFKTLDDLTKVEEFPISKIEIIKLYLQL